MNAKLLAAFLRTIAYRLDPPPRESYADFVEKLIREREAEVERERAELRGKLPMTYARKLRSVAK